MIKILLYLRQTHSFQIKKEPMKPEILHANFLRTIEEKIPQKTEIANVISDTLGVAKDKAYRRLRGEVPFTFYEAMAISRELGISLDSLDMISPMSKPMRLRSIEYIHPAETDFALMEEMIAILKFYKDEPQARGGEITNILPQPLYVGYEHIFRFYLFKWRYQFRGLQQVIPYKDIVIVDKLQKILDENVKWARCLQTEYVFDRQLFDHLVASVKHFYYVDLITEEEVELIKNDLLKIVNEIEQWTCDGVFEETGKKINFYISDIHIDTNYCYVEAPDYQLTIIKVLLLNGVATTDRKAFEEMKHLLHAAKNQSTLITGCNEKDRYAFLKKQQEVIHSLSRLD